MVAAKDADFCVSAQWIIRPARALIDISGKERKGEAGDAGTSHRDR
jgi:hypothetical protein